ncbi:TetR/AcrR family transcriptional regulator [Mycolicibacterium moriokaense]|uniref:TetR family transcriptional regulator n=1 Tax=Mycolicibacterium moriokaense TaxID=39691 RepID=A0A318H9U1_9MYCO|nr:TetR/AcrR family transcriptional regulator [Mycolicibacterium moriokaense]PXX03253.1 TetR family transcriptional regulator [Mycolicibacterium moriokaense]
MSRRSVATVPERSGAATDRGDSAKRILTAARQLVLQQGARRLSLTDVATLAGVSRPTLYRYFPSKEDLITALGKLEYRRINSAMDNAISALSGRKRLEAAVDVVAHFLSEQPPRSLIDLDPGFVNDEVAHVLPLITDALTAVLTKCAKEADVALPATPRDMASTIARIALSHYLFPDSDPRAARRQIRAAAGLCGRRREL